MVMSVNRNLNFENDSKKLDDQNLEDWSHNYSQVDFRSFWILSLCEEQANNTVERRRLEIVHLTIISDLNIAFEYFINYFIRYQQNVIIWINSWLIMFLVEWICAGDAENKIW